MRSRFVAIRSQQAKTGLFLQRNKKPETPALLKNSCPEVPMDPFRSGFNQAKIYILIQQGWEISGDGHNNFFKNQRLNV
jgi:hypothetical protein